MSSTLKGFKIGIMSQYFLPETGAAANRMAFFSYWLWVNGADITIVTAMPNYPEGIIQKRYRRKLWCRDSCEYGTVLRAWCYTSPKRTTVRRLFNYITFMVSSLRWLRELRRCDVVVFSSGPMFAGFAAFVANKLFGTRVILDARDLWPDRIWESGAVAPPFWIERILHKYEEYMYRNVEAITCATKGVRDAIANRLSSSVVTAVIRNCDQTTDEGGIHALPPIRQSRNVLRVIEAGTLGWAQDPKTLCDAFNVLLERGEDGVELAFAGSGPRVAQLEEDIQFLSGHARHVGHLSRDELEKFIGSSDIGVVTLAPTEHNLMTVSRRIYDYARAGLAIVYCGAGEGAELIQAAKAGLVVEPGNSIELANIINDLITDGDSLMYWKRSSRRLLEGEYAPNVIAGKFIDIVVDVLHEVE